MDHLDNGTQCKWFYPPRQPAPRGVKMNLLTIGNQSVVGSWTDDGSVKAWHPLLKRDKDYEREMGYLTEAF